MSIEGTSGSKHQTPRDLAERAGVTKTHDALVGADRARKEQAEDWEKKSAVSKLFSKEEKTELEKTNAAREKAEAVFKRAALVSARERLLGKRFSSIENARLRKGISDDEARDLETIQDLVKRDVGKYLRKDFNEGETPDTLKRRLRLFKKLRDEAMGKGRPAASLKHQSDVIAVHEKMLRENGDDEAVRLGLTGARARHAKMAAAIDPIKRRKVLERYKRMMLSDKAIQNTVESANIPTLTDVVDTDGERHKQRRILRNLVEQFPEADSSQERHIHELETRARELSQRARESEAQEHSRPLRERAGEGLRTFARIFKK